MPFSGRQLGRGTVLNTSLQQRYFARLPKTLSLIAGAMAIAFVGLAAIDLSTTSAHAQSATCKRLERQLASSSGGTVSQRYAKAIRSQNRQIKKVQRSMNSYGCASKKRLFKREAHASCGNLRNTLGRMKSNLSSLKTKGGSKSLSSSERKRIQRSMKRNSCGQYANLKREKKQRTILEQVFGKSKKQQNSSNPDKDWKVLKRERSKKNKYGHNLRKYNTVRTICVRTCDGYHFPVNFSTHKSNVERDSAACASLCPGTETELYVHRSGGEASENMTSVVTGLPYGELPNAFVYQESYNAQCSCNYRLLKREKPTMEITPEEQERLDAQEQRRAISRIALPAWRSDRGQDPETIGNRKGLLTMEIVKALKKPESDTKIVSRSARIRVIGEEFLPNQ